MKVLKKGSNGKSVTELQALLNALGFIDLDTGKPLVTDGKFGPATDRVVRRFQVLSGLEDSGAIDEATGTALFARFAELHPAAAPAPVPQPPPVEPAFDDDGWYLHARRVPLHPGRVGAPIKPHGATVHTTDTLGGMAGMLQRWHEKRGDGGGAHFMLGRRAPTLDELDAQWPSSGLVQMVPITRNGNHAGGPDGRHGRVIVPGLAPRHPNSVYVGIEIVAGGRLQKAGSKAQHKDSGKLVPDDEVFWDERAQPWHVVTPYQFKILGQLLDHLDEVCERFPSGAKLQPNGSYLMNGVTWAALPGVRFVTHVALDPIRKTDPGPQVTTWLRERYPG